MNNLKKLAFAFAATCFAGVTFAQSFVEGVNYERLVQPVGVADPSKIEVVEAFSYSCGGCFAFEPKIQAFKAQQLDDVAVVQTHVTYSRDNELLANVFYTAKALGVLDTMHQKIFDAIHLSGKRYSSKADYRELFVANGVDGGDFDKTINSFGIRGQVRRAEKLLGQYGVNGTPQLVVDGTYIVRLSEQNPDPLAVVSFLVERIRAERADN